MLKLIIFNIHIRKGFRVNIFNFYYMEPENEEEIKPPTRNKGTIKTAEIRHWKQKDSIEKSRNPRFDILNRLIVLIIFLLQCLKKMVEASVYTYCG